MPNSYFKFKQFTIEQEGCSMKVGTDGVLLGAWVKVVDGQSVLDIGTGTGLLALMLAQKAKVHIDAVELDENAAKMAQLNVSKCPWHNGIHVVHTSVQNYHVDTLYDIIVSNPPFFSNDLRTPDLQRSLARHDDTLSLKELLTAVNRYLSEKGTFSMVFPAKRIDELLATASQFGLVVQRRLNVFPTPNKPCSRVFVSFGRCKTEFSVEEMVIESYGRHGYSDEYKNLTREYYLNF